MIFRTTKGCSWINLRGGSLVAALLSIITGALSVLFVTMPNAALGRIDRMVNLLRVTNGLYGLFAVYKNQAIWFRWFNILNWATYLIQHVSIIILDLYLGQMFTDLCYEHATITPAPTTILKAVCLPLTLRRLLTIGSLLLLLIASATQLKLCFVVDEHYHRLSSDEEELHHDQFLLNEIKAKSNIDID